MILYLKVAVGVEGVLVWLEGRRDEGEEGVWAHKMWGLQAGSPQEALGEKTRSANEKGATERNV